MQKTEFQIDGMHCKSCAILIESSLSDENGIKSAKVDFASKKAFLEFDPTIHNIETIKGLIGGLGYKVG